jgi:hypothetical protein
MRWEDRLEDTIACLPPARRRRWALRLAVWTFIATPVNVGIYMLGWISEAVLIVETLALSWLAVTFTAIDLVATTDVRVEQEDPED